MPSNSKDTRSPKIIGQELSEQFSDAVGINDKNVLQQLTSALSIYVDEQRKARSPLNPPALKKLIDTLRESRGLPLKIAQVVTFLDPKAPPELREVLEVIQNHRRGMPLAEVVNTFRRE